MRILEEPRTIIVLLALAGCVLLAVRFVGNDATQRAGYAAGTPGVRRDAAPPAVASPEPSRPAQRSVAVLPFALLSSGPDDDYFADGLTEEIINTLTQVPGLLVTARTSAFQLRVRKLPVSDAARELGVDNVVEGSVYRAGNRLRVTAQLVHAADSVQLWSESYDRETTDTFAVRTDIAEKVVQALNLPVDDSLRARMQRVGTRSVEAIVAYQKGFGFYERAHAEPNLISLLRQANGHFEEAAGLAPDLFAAHELHRDLFSNILISNASGQLDGDITEQDVMHAPGSLQRDFDKAMRAVRNANERDITAFDRALMLGPWRGLELLSANAEASPGCSRAAGWLHLVAPFPGQAGGVLAAFRRMAACDPLRAQPMAHVGGAELWLGRPAEAGQLTRDFLHRADHPGLERHLVLALAFAGDAATAREAANTYVRSEDELLSLQAMLFALAGNEARAAAAESGYLGKYGPNDREALVMEAVRGQRGEANRLAGEIDARPFGHVVLLQAVYACFCGAPFDLDATPAFASLLRDSGLAWPPARPYEFPLKDW